MRRVWSARLLVDFCATLSSVFLSRLRTRGHSVTSLAALTGEPATEVKKWNAGLAPVPERHRPLLERLLALPTIKRSKATR